MLWPIYTKRYGKDKETSRYGSDKRRYEGHRISEKCVRRGKAYGESGHRKTSLQTDSAIQKRMPKLLRYGRNDETI